MSHKMIVWALELDAEVFETPTDKWVLVALANYARDEQKYSFPKVALLANTTGLSERTVFRALTSLVKCGLLTKEQRGGGRRSTTYVFNISTRRQQLRTGMTG